MCQRLARSPTSRTVAGEGDPPSRPSRRPGRRTGTCLEPIAERLLTALAGRLYFAMSCSRNPARERWHRDDMSSVAAEAPWPPHLRAGDLPQLVIDYPLADPSHVPPAMTSVRPSSPRHAPSILSPWCVRVGFAQRRVRRRRLDGRPVASTRVLRPSRHFEEAVFTTAGIGGHGAWSSCCTRSRAAPGPSVGPAYRFRVVFRITAAVLSPRLPRPRRFTEAQLESARASRSRDAVRSPGNGNASRIPG